MVSYDIKSLYTNIPVSETIEITCNKIFAINSSFHAFDRTTFCKFLQLAVSNTYFFFNKVLYKQLDGLAMGNPLAPTLANIFLCNLESNIFNSCPINCKPAFYKRYLDDTFAIFNNENEATSFFAHINNIHPNIKFTIEKQQSNTLPFLDLSVHYNDNTFNSSVYRKPTFTGLGLSFFSCSPLKYKINSIQTLLHRGYMLCSSYFEFQKEIEFLQTYFINNGYPLTLFKSCLSGYLNKLSQTNQTISTVSKKIVHFSFPYYDEFSTEFCEYVSTILNKNHPYLDFRFALVNSFKIKSFFQYKDQLTVDLCSNIIYRYTCGTCNSSYIGSTIKQSKIRFCQHIGISHRTNKPISSLSHSSIRAHCHENSHPLKIDEFKIIDTTNKQIDLRILESLYIHKEKPNLNSDQSAVPLLIF